MKRRSTLFLVPIGLILFLGLLFTGLWFSERLPSGLREWLYLKVANISGKATREPADFDFFVVGHLYGSPSIDDHLPDRLLLQRLPEIISSKPDFMVSLGDVVYQKNQTDFSNLDMTLLQKLPFPLYNTPGNHDVANDPSLYESYFGKQTYFGQDYGSARLIFLDTEQVECGLDEPQLEMLQQELNNAIHDPETHFIFVFMHKTLVFQNPEMKALKNKQAMPNVWDCQKKDGANPLMEKYLQTCSTSKTGHYLCGRCWRLGKPVTVLSARSLAAVDPCDDRVGRHPAGQYHPGACCS